MATITADQEPLTSIVYVSSGRSQREQDVVQILRESRINNARLNITGMLAYKDGNFLQVLEGGESTLNHVLEKIERDSRHGGMIVLTRTRVKARLFAEWSMAFRELKDLLPDDAAAYNPFMDGARLDEGFRSRPELCYKLLLSFKQSMR